MKIKISKIIATIMFILVMLYGARNVCLNMFGKTTIGYTISTTQRTDRDSDTNSKRFRNTVSYYFEVSGNRYESHASYKTNMPIVRKDDQVVEKVVVQYFDFFPYISNLEKYNENTLLNNVFCIGLIITCLLIILAIWGVRFKKKQFKKILKDSKIWVCDCGVENDGKFCETCGRNKNI